MSFQPSNRHQFVWKVPNFSGRTQKSKTYIFSHVFHSPNLFQTEWKMKIGVKGPDKNNSTSIYVKRCFSASDTGPADLFLQMEVCLLDAEKKEYYKHYKKCNFKKGRKRGFTYFVERKRIIECRNTLLQDGILTVQCCLWKCPLDEILPMITQYSAKITVEHLSFMWTLGWFREWELEVKRSILLGSDIAVNGFELYGTLELESDEQEAPTVVLCLNIAPMTVNTRQVFLSGTVSVLDWLQRPAIIVNGQHYFEAGSKVAWRFARIFKFHLADPSKHILDLNTLKINCVFSIADGNRARRTRDHLTPLIEELRNDEKTLVADIAHFFHSETFPDIHLKLGNEMFAAHRVILSARSPIFYEALRKAHCKLKSRRALPIHGTESEPDNVEEKKDEDWILPLHDSDTDTAQKNVAQMSRHRALSLDNFVPDYLRVPKNVAQNSSHRTLPNDDDSDSDSDFSPRRVNKKKGCRTPLHSDPESEPGASFSPEHDNGDSASESSNDSKWIDSEDKVNANSTISLNSSDSKSEDDQKGTDESPRTSPSDNSVLQCVKTEPESDDVPESPTDENSRTSPLDDSVSQCVKTEPESDDVPESPLASPLDDSASKCGYKTEPESEDDVLESSNDITISLKNGSFVAEISRISRHTLQQMVRCMYTDTVDNMSVESAVDLFRAGVKYGFPLLREKCESLLICSINMRTVYYLLHTADSVSMLKLREAILNFIERNSESILLSDEWQVFLDTHKELGTNTLRYLRGRKYRPV